MRISEYLRDNLTLLKEEIQALRLDNQDIKQELEQQRGFNQALIEQLHQYERGSLERHNKLTESLKETMEARKMIAAANEQGENQNPNLDNQKKGFFARLFGK